MKVCEVVLVALLVCQFPSTSLQQSELSTDDLLRVFDLSHIPRTSKDKFAVPRYVMSLYNTKVRMARFWRENSEVIRTFFREGKPPLFEISISASAGHSLLLRNLLRKHV